MTNRVVASGEVLRAVLKMKIFGQDVQNTLAFQAQGATDTDSLTTELDAFANLLMLAVSRDVTFVGWRFSDLYPGVLPSVDSADYVGPGNVGSLPADSDVSFEAGVISWVTGLRGQGNRGRIYVPGMTHTALSAGLLTAGEVALLQAAGDYMWNHFNTPPVPPANYRFGIWRYHFQRVPVIGGQTALTIANPLVAPFHLNHEPVYAYPPTDRSHPINPNAFLEVTGAVVRDRARSQRRRGIGVHITRAHRV